MIPEISEVPRRVRTSCALVLAGSLAILAATVPARAGGEPVVEGGKLEFSLPDLGGKPVSPEDSRLAGKVLLVDLWGTWCPPCLSEIPVFVDLRQKYGEHGLEVVGIAFERDEDPSSRRAALSRFVSERGINYLVLDGGHPDSFGSVLPGLRNVQGLPIEILVDRGGRVTSCRNGYGYKKRWARKLEREVRDLLGLPER